MNILRKELGGARTVDYSMQMYVFVLPFSK